MRRMPLAARVESAARRLAQCVALALVEPGIGQRTRAGLRGPDQRASFPGNINPTCHTGQGMKAAQGIRSTPMTCDSSGGTATGLRDRALRRAPTQNAVACRRAPRRRGPIVVLLAVLFAPSLVPAATVPGCAGAATYTPAYPPTRLPERDQGDVSVILLHGKSGSKFAPQYTNLITDLADHGFNVVIPNMTWWREWDGTQCQGLNYLKALVDAERARGMRVLLIGHSMGGMHSLLYAMHTGHGLEAVIPVAPGHMLPLSTTVVNATQPYVEEARRMVAQGRGDELATFYTYDGGLREMQPTTPNIYLSYHDTNITPDFNFVLPAIKPRWLWIVGDADPNRDFNQRQISKLPDNPQSEFVITSGDHFTALDRVADLLHEWFQTWSQIGAPPSGVSNPPMRLSVEDPFSGSIKAGVRNLRGYLVALNPPTSLSLFVDGVPYGELEHHGPRPDVGNAFPQYPNSDESGFNIVLNYGDNIGPGSHTIQLVAEDSNGGVVEAFVPFTVDSFNTPFVFDDGLVSLSGATITHDSDDTITIQNLLHDGRRYRVRLKWTRQTQNYEAIEITPLQ